jgi:hypothetical protein
MGRLAKGRDDHGDRLGISGAIGAMISSVTLGFLRLAGFMARKWIKPVPEGTEQRSLAAPIGGRSLLRRIARLPSFWLLLG